MDSVNYTLEAREDSPDMRLITSRVRVGLHPGRRPTPRLARGRGFTLLELVVVIIIVSFLAVIAIAKLLAIQVDAERVSMETVVGTLRSAIGMAVAESIVKRDMHGIEALVGSNPMDRLAETPHNYLGAIDHPNPAGYEDGNWYFDKDSRELVYLVRNRANFAGGVSDPPRARFKVEPAYRDQNGNKRFDSSIDTVEGLRLTPIEPYKWIR
jgi:prepilin-type N-terminal cleavage/methylation domain-containing protein